MLALSLERPFSCSSTLLYSKIDSASRKKRNWVASRHTWELWVIFERLVTFLLPGSMLLSGLPTLRCGNAHLQTHAPRRDQGINRIDLREILLLHLADPLLLRQRGLIHSFQHCLITREHSLKLCCQGLDPGGDGLESAGYTLPFFVEFGVDDILAFAQFLKLHRRRRRIGAHGCRLACTDRSP